MNESYQQSPQHSSSEINIFLIFCLDKDGVVNFEGSWGNTSEDVKKFSSMLHSVTSGKYNRDIFSKLKEMSKEVEMGEIRYGEMMSSFNKIQNFYKNKSSKGKLVVDPTRVELNP